MRHGVSFLFLADSNLSLKHKEKFDMIHSVMAPKIVVIYKGTIMKKLNDLASSLRYCGMTNATETVKIAHDPDLCCYITYHPIANEFKGARTKKASARKRTEKA